MTPPGVSTGDAQFVLSALSVLGIEKAKAWTRIPWISRETDKLNRFVAVVLSFAGSIGVGISFHAGVLTINNLTWSTALAAFLFFGRSLAGQELIYRVVKVSAHISELSQTFAVLSSSHPEPSANDGRKTWEELAAEREAQSGTPPEAT